MKKIKVENPGYVSCFVFVIIIVLCIFLGTFFSELGDSSKAKIKDLEKRIDNLEKKDEKEKGEKK